MEEDDQKPGQDADIVEPAEAVRGGIRAVGSPQEGISPSGVFISSSIYGICIFYGCFLFSSPPAKRGRGSR
jgi:hypothetical protein